MKNGEVLECRKDPRLVELAEALKVLSEPNRLRIICYLLGATVVVSALTNMAFGFLAGLAAHYSIQLACKGKKRHGPRGR